MAGMIVDAVNKVMSAPTWVRSTSVIPPPITAASTVAHVGPPVALGTCRHSWYPGSLRSLAMDQISRLLVTMMISPQANIEMQTKIKNSFETTPPSTSCTMNATGAALVEAALIELVA